MQITMWRTTKRDNSTATPTSQPTWFTNSVTKDVNLKQPTDVLNPVFTLRMGGHDGQNYLSAFGRYYWITGIKSLANELWEISCKIDPLGSYRGHIQNTSAYVLYDSTPNTEIPDSRLGVHTTATYSNNQVSMPWGFLQGDGTKFVALEGDGDLITQGRAQSATGVYIMSDIDIQAIGMPFNWSEIWNSFANVRDTRAVPFQRMGHSGETLGDLFTLFDGASTWDKFQYGLYIGINIIPVSVLALVETVKGLITGGDALRHVKSAYWLPFKGNWGTGVSQIAIGSYVDTIPTAKRVDDPIVSDEINISIPYQFSDWRNVQNTEIQLFIPLIGLINIPSSAVRGHSTLNLYFGLNLYSGHLAVRVRCADATIGTYGANVASPILIGDSNPNAPAITNSIVSATAMVAGAVTGTGALTAGAIGAGIQNGLGCIQPISTSVGGIGGGIGNSLGSQIWCTTICHNTSDAPSDLLPIIGTPTNVLKQLNGSGFCQTMQAHMSMTAVTGESYPTESEVQQVNSALNNGVFLE